MKPTDLTPKVTAGLAKYGDDFHAILGAPLTANESQIRRSYIKVAKLLHPDGYAGSSDERELASWLFSKLVSPANEVMSREKERTEYTTILKLRTKQLLSLPASDIWPKTEAAQALINCGDLDKVYTDKVHELAAILYQDLSVALERIGELSKLNLAYLLLSNNFKVPAALVPKPSSAKPSVRPPSTPVPSNSTPSNSAPRYTPAQPPPPKAEPSNQTAPPPKPSVSNALKAKPEPAAVPETPPPDPGQVRFEQAMAMMSRKSYREAIQFFNFAISSDSQKSEYYLQRGIAHQEMGNLALARPDFQRALMLDPNNTEAKQHLKSAAVRPATPAETQAATKPATTSNPDPKKGLFGRFFNR